jgi:hypothetical protein
MSLRGRFHRKIRKRSHRCRYLSVGGFTGRSFSGRGLTDKDVSHAGGGFTEITFSGRGLTDKDVSQEEFHRKKMLRKRSHR